MSASSDDEFSNIPVGYGYFGVFLPHDDDSNADTDLGNDLIAASEISSKELQDIEKALKESDMDMIPPPESPTGLTNNDSHSDNLKELLRLSEMIGNEKNTARSDSVTTGTCDPDETAGELHVDTFTSETIETTPPYIKRFKKVTDEQLKEYEEANQSNSTKRNTAWALRIFQDWHREVYDGMSIDFSEVSAETLATKLGKFFCEARPKNPDQRAASMKKQHAEEYHKNTLKNIRAALNRHLQDIGRDVDIVRDKQFKTCNKTINGMLKDKVRSGTSRPTAHKAIISKEDLAKISSYLEKGYKSSPVILRQAVWYSLAIHFVSRGLEFHKQLRVDSFNFCHDENGLEYVTINHLTQEKTFQGNLSNLEPPSDKRMYAIVDSEFCPIKLLRLLLTKTDPSAEMLFNHYVRDMQISSPIWFTNKPLAARTFANMMTELCKGACLTRKYTAHCLRATCIEFLSHSGYESRCIMFLSGHRNEASLRSYNRSCSTEQKKSLSSSLSAIAAGKRDENSNKPRECQPPAICDVPLCNELQVVPTVSRNTQTQGQSYIPFQSNLSSFTSGFLSNSTFHGCTFSFGK